MTNIKQKFDQIEATKFDIGAVAFFSDVHKKTREWQLLGATQGLLLAGGEDAPVYAEEKDPPDFIAYDSSMKLWSNIEIVEVLSPGYKRHEFFKLDALPNAPQRYDVPPPLANPWEPLRQCLEKKARKGYPSPITLVVLYGIGRQDWRTPFNEQLLAEHTTRPFSGLDSFDRVLILNCDVRSMIEIHPRAKTIVPDKIWSSD